MEGDTMETPVRKGKAWLILVLLFLFMLINFADKVVVGLAGVPIMRDLGLSPTQFGELGSAFFLLFPVSAVAFGFIANRVQTRWVIGVLALVWALTQFPMLGTVGYGVLLASRIALGAGEGPAFPVAIHAAYKWFPNDQRTLPSGILSLGSAVGVFIAAPVLTYLIFHVSWHAAFGALGAVGLVWVVLWLLLAEEGPIVDAPVTTAAGPRFTLAYRRLFGTGTVVGTLVGGWVAYWGLALALTWIPTYAAQVLHYTPETIGYLTAAQWLFGGLLVFGSGALSQWLKGKGATSRRSRGIFTAGCVVAGGICTIVMAHTAPGAPQMILQVLGFSLPSVVFALGPAMLSEVAPHSQRGAILGIQTAFQTTAGLVAPFAMGWIIERAAVPEAGYQQGFIVAGLLSIAGGSAGMWLLRPEHDVRKLTGQEPVRVPAASAVGGG